MKKPAEFQQREADIVTELVDSLAVQYFDPVEFIELVASELANLKSQHRNPTPTESRAK